MIGGFGGESGSYMTEERAQEAADVCEQYERGTRVVRSNSDEVFKELESRNHRFQEQTRKGTLKELPKSQVYKHGEGVLAFANTDAIVEAGIDEGAGCIPFVVTTSDEDRDGDIVLPMGCRLENYSRNPVVFFGHQQWEIPIGVCRNPAGDITVYPEPNRVVDLIYFDRQDPDADFVYGKCKRKILNATSIAFVPIVARRREEMLKAHQHGGGTSGWFFEEWDKTEVSIVGVPSNPYATSQQKDMRGELRDALDREKSHISPKLQKALAPFCQEAKGRCWSGWCPVPSQPVTKSVPTRADVLAAAENLGRTHDETDLAVLADMLEEADGPEYLVERIRWYQDHPECRLLSGLANDIQRWAKGEARWAQLDDEFREGPRETFDKKFHPGTRVICDDMASVFAGKSGILQRDGSVRFDGGGSAKIPPHLLSSFEEEHEAVPLEKAVRPMGEYLLQVEQPEDGKGKWRWLVMRREDGLGVARGRAENRDGAYEAAGSWVQGKSLPPPLHAETPDGRRVFRGMRVLVPMGLGTVENVSPKGDSVAVRLDKSKKLVSVPMSEVKAGGMMERALLPRGQDVGTDRRGKKISVGDVVEHGRLGRLVILGRSRDGLRCEDGNGREVIAEPLECDLESRRSKSVKKKSNKETVARILPSVFEDASNLGVLSDALEEARAPQDIIDQVNRMRDDGYEPSMPTAMVWQEIRAWINGPRWSVEFIRDQRVVSDYDFVNGAWEHMDGQEIDDEDLRSISIALNGTNHNQERGSFGDMTWSAQKYGVRMKGRQKAPLHGHKVPPLDPDKYTLHLGDIVIAKTTIFMPGMPLRKFAVKGDRLVIVSEQAPWMAQNDRGERQVVSLHENVRKKDMHKCTGCRKQYATPLAASKCSCGKKYLRKAEGDDFRDMRDVREPKVPRSGDRRRATSWEPVDMERGGFPDFVDDADDREKLEQFAPEELDSWRRETAAHKRMPGSRRMNHRAVLEVTFDALKAAYDMMKGKTKAMDSTTGASGGYTVASGCPMCHGTGVCDGKACTRCKGAGMAKTLIVPRTLRRMAPRKRKKRLVVRCEKGYVKRVTKAKGDDEKDDMEYTDDADLAMDFDDEDEAIDMAEEVEGVVEPTEPFEPKESAKFGAKLFTVLKGVVETMKKELEKLDHPEMIAELRDIFDTQIPATMEHVKNAVHKFHGKEKGSPDEFMDMCCKGLETSGATGFGVNPGEAGMVDNGIVPPDATRQGISPEGSTAEILERYEAKGKWFTRVKGHARVAKGGKLYWVGKAQTEPDHSAAVGDAAQYMVEMSLDGDVPQRHKAPLGHHAKQLDLVHKALTDSGKVQRDGGPGKVLSNTGHEERDGGKGKPLSEAGAKQGKSLDAAMEKSLEELTSFAKRNGIPIP